MLQVLLPLIRSRWFDQLFYFFSVVKKLEDVTALDYFFEKNEICWNEVSKGQILCSDIHPKYKGRVNKKIIVDTGISSDEDYGGGIEGLACDWVNDNIYWTDSATKRIEVTSLPGKKQHYR